MTDGQGRGRGWFRARMGMRSDRLPLPRMNI